jgi:hypothetical protein
MRRGFKSECESLASAIRAELGVDTRVPLDPRALAAHLEIPLRPVSSLAGPTVRPEVDHVMTVGKSVLSAITIFPDWPKRRRVILFNDANSPARQSSDIAHELAHGLLLHEPRHPFVNGCRDYNRGEEDEAAWLAGCLLVPRDAAFQVAWQRQPVATAAVEYGVSQQLMTWRINQTGAGLQAERSRARWAPQAVPPRAAR